MAKRVHDRICHRSRYSFMHIYHSIFTRLNMKTYTQEEVDEIHNRYCQEIAHLQPLPEHSAGHNKAILRLNMGCRID